MQLLVLIFIEGGGGDVAILELNHAHLGQFVAHAVWHGCCLKKKKFY